MVSQGTRFKNKKGQMEAGGRGGSWWWPANTLHNSKVLEREKE